MQERFATLGIELARLLDEEVVDVRIAARGIDAVAHEVVLDARGRVAMATGARLLDRGDLLVLPAREERRPFHRPHLGADPHRREVVPDGFGDGGVGGIARIVAGIEPVRVPGFGEELLRARGVVG